MSHINIIQLVSERADSSPGALTLQFMHLTTTACLCGQRSPLSGGSQRVVLSGSLGGQNYFHNEKIYPHFSFSFSDEYTEEFSRGCKNYDDIITLMADVFVWSCVIENVFI